MRPIPVVLIVGVGYSGSTLLDLMLGSHSEVVGVGELVGFDAFSQRNSLCTCWRPRHDCAFWNEVVRCLVGDEPTASFAVHPPHATPTEVVANTVALFAAISRTTSARYVIDSSKRWRRARILSQVEALDVRVIHLLRDGRGVGYSHARRGESFGDAVEYWATANLAIRRWLDESDRLPFVTVHYEDLCADPEGSLTGVCEFMNLAWEPSMLTFFSVEHHNIAGNPMRLLGQEAIRVDEAWIRALTTEQQADFRRLAGAAATQLGY
ncbi:MAG: sulfotransferase [Actinomycetota bacterium]|nr:sulfotransferase [Actinomycetota bacterium]